MRVRQRVKRRQCESGASAQLRCKRVKNPWRVAIGVSGHQRIMDALAQRLHSALGNLAAGRQRFETRERLPKAGTMLQKRELRKRVDRRQTGRQRQTDRRKLAGRLERTELPSRAGLKSPGLQSSATGQLKRTLIGRREPRKQIITLGTMHRENQLAQHTPTLLRGRIQQRVTTSIIM